MAFRLDNGELAFVSQFHNHKKHGFTVLMSDGAPWLIQEFRHGKANKFHICEQYIVKQSFDPDAKDPVLNEAMLQLAELEKLLLSHEKLIKRWVKSVDLDERQATAAENSLAARARAAQRKRQRKAADDAVMRANYRKAGW